MVDFLDSLEDAALDGEIVTDPVQAMARFREVEDDIFQESIEILHGALGFAAIDPEVDAPPQSWIDRLGYAKAMERYRLAKYALMSQKEAPVGLKMAQNVHASITKARASGNKLPARLNVMLVQMPAAQVQYPVLDVTPEDK